MARRGFLPFFLLLCCSVAVQSVIYQLKGQQVHLDPGITGQLDNILWMHNGNKVVEFNGAEEHAYGSYEGRVTLDWHFAQLQISDLRLEDSGEYEYEIYIQGKLQRKSYKLEVLEKVAKPSITCEMNNSSSSDVSAVLLCSVEVKQPQSSVNYKWISKENVHYGTRLTIFLGAELDEEEYTCQVSNPLSNETATFRAKDCKTDAGLSAGIIALIVVIPTVIVCVGLVILFYRLKQKDLACRKKGQKADLENPTSPEGHVRKIVEEMNKMALKRNDNMTGKEKSGPQETVEDDRTRPNFDRAPTLPSTRPLARFVKEPKNSQQSMNKQMTDEETSPLLGDQPTATSPQPQIQPDTKNADDEESQPRLPQPGSVRKRVEEINKKSTTKKKSAGLNRKLLKNEKKRPELDEKFTPSSPPPGQLDTTKDPDTEKLREPVDINAVKTSTEAKADPAAVSEDVTEDTQSDLKSHASLEHSGSETEDRGAQSDAGGGLPAAAQTLSPLTQNSPDTAPQDTEVSLTEFNKDVATDFDPDSSWQGTDNKPDHSHKDDQRSPTAEHRGGQDLSQNDKSEDNQQKTEQQLSAADGKADNEDDKMEEAETKSDSDDPSQEENSDDSKQYDNDTQPSFTPDQRGPETTQGGIDPNLSQEETDKSEDNQQKPEKQDSADEQRADNKAEEVEEAEASCESDNQSEQEESNECTKNDKDTQSFTTPDQRGPATTQGGIDPNLSREETDKSEDNQQKPEKQDSADEQQADNKAEEVEERETSCESDNQSEEEESNECMKNDKDTQSFTTPEQRGPETTQGAMEQDSADEQQADSKAEEVEEAEASSDKVDQEKIDQNNA